MSKVSGLGGALTVADAAGTVQTLTDDTTNWQLSTPRAVQDVTGLGKSANARILLLSDISVTFNGVVNPGTNTSHEVFNTITNTSVQRATGIVPTSGTTPALYCNLLLTDYQITRANTGELTWQVPGSLADGTVPVWT